MCDELEGESDELTTATRSSLKELITSIAVFALPERQVLPRGQAILYQGIITNKRVRFRGLAIP